MPGKTGGCWAGFSGPAWGKVSWEDLSSFPFLALPVPQVFSERQGRVILPDPTLQMLSYLGWFLRSKLEKGVQVLESYETSAFK